jgi:Zn-dependent peptidase ImmA (M78 family)
MSKSVSKWFDKQLYNTLKELAVKRDIHVFERKGPKQLHGFIAFMPKQTFIFINKYLSISEKSFTLAHELGHYMRHRNNLNSLLYDSDYGYHDLIEQEADAYGNRLLRLVIKILSKQSSEYSDLKSGNKHPRKSA